MKFNDNCLGLSFHFASILLAIFPSNITSSSLNDKNKILDENIFVLLELGTSEIRIAAKLCF